jgi:two-component system, NarL family, sensor histidine kinase DesK
MSLGMQVSGQAEFARRDAHQPRVREAGSRMRFKLPARRRRTPWGAIFWAVPVAYVFLDPYQRGAHWVEWTLTTLAFVIFLLLYLAGMMYWDNRRILAGVCWGVLALGMAFFGLRYSGAVFFTMVAAFAPFTVGGNAPRSAALVLGIFALMWIEWLLTHASAAPNHVWPLVLTLQGMLVAAGTTFAARETAENERDLRVAERERIARDLHDVLGHTLSSIALKAELAGRLFHDQPRRALAEINDVEQISRDALDDVRNAIHGYYAGDIRTEFERAESMLHAAGIQTERRFETITMDPAQERVLALALREAVTNVVRHAKAKLCKLALYRSTTAYRLEVADDGCGGSITEGLGVRSIRARVEAVGGSVAWHSEAGTRLVIVLPLALASASR